MTFAFLIGTAKMSKYDALYQTDRRPLLQLSLPGAGVPPRLSVPRAPRHSRHTSCIDDDPLFATYARRLVARGAAEKTSEAYRYQLQTMLNAAQRLTNESSTLNGLFHDPSLLGRVLLDDRGVDGGGQLSRWTLAQRRSAVRSFATLMRPELLLLIHKDPLRHLDRALRSVAERIGAGYRLTGGAARQRGGYAPSADDIRKVLEVVGAEPGFIGMRNSVFFAILATSGARVNALRGLDGRDCVWMPSGRLRLFLHEKGKREAREIELDREQSDRLQDYVQAFNACATTKNWEARIHLGSPGAVWCEFGGRNWTYKRIAITLRTGCSRAGAPRFTPHAFRRAFASDAATVLPRHVVGLAGGWQGIERLDDHYIQVRESALWAKLDHANQRHSSEKETVARVYAAAHDV